MSSSDAQLLRITLDGRPQPIEVPLSKTAVLVVDMQNDYGSVGGLFERNGIDISGIRELIAPIARVLASARRVGVPVVYTKAALRPDFSDLPEPGSPLRDRWLAYGAGALVQAPDGRPSRVLIRDTWNTDVIDELKPEPGDIEVYKHGYSAFHETELDAVLKRLGAKYLIVTGCTTSVCVESTIRDAHSRLLLHPPRRLHSRTYWSERGRLYRCTRRRKRRIELRSDSAPGSDHFWLGLKVRVCDPGIERRTGPGFTRHLKP